MSYDEIFNRVSKLIENVNVKTASVKEAADEAAVEEYNVWSEVDPKDQRFLKAVDQILSEAVPASPTNTEEAEEGTEEELQEAYPTTEVYSAGEGDVEPEEVESAIQGEDEIKESTLKRASDIVLTRAFHKLAKDIVTYLAAQDTGVKTAALNDVSSISAACVANLVKQAEFDAALVAGYLYSVKSAADEDSEQQDEDEDTENSDAVAEALADNVEKSVEENVEEGEENVPMSQEEAEAVINEVQDLIESVPEQELDDVIAGIVEENPEAALQAVQENPEVADALIDALTNSSNSAALENLSQTMEKGEQGTEEETEEETEEKKDEGPDLEDLLETEKQGAFAQISALSAAMEELGVTPEDVELAVAGTQREDEGIKVAAAIREFRKKPVSKTARGNAQLRVGFKQYLRDLMFGS